MNKQEQCLLDSNFLVALIDKSDVHHNKANLILADLKEKKSKLFLSDLSINEVLSVLARRCEAKKNLGQFTKLAKKFQKFLSPFPILCLYELMPKMYKEIQGVMLKFAGCFNFHDSMMIVFLRQIPSVHLVTFDKDFAEQTPLKIIP